MRECGLYDPKFEHDACGIGAVVSIKGVKTHKVIDDALHILANLKHRGGIGVEENTGDGAGVLIQIPHEFFKKVAGEKNISLPNEGEYAVGSIFLPQNINIRKNVVDKIEAIIKDKGFSILFWREVPCDTIELGDTSKNAMPNIRQIIIKKPKEISPGLAFERALYILRRQIEKVINALEEMKEESFYIVSLSSKTLVYKGMLVSTQVKSFYLDLQDEAMKSALAMVHSRYSTNTFPSWERAHPNRMIVHNGEINTLRGNVNKVYSREGTLT